MCKAVTVICYRMERKKANDFFSKAQIAGGAAMAFMHGAQDGQKFMGVLLLGLFLVNGSDCANATIPVWMMILCSAVMGIGCKRHDSGMGAYIPGVWNNRFPYG